MRSGSFADCAAGPTSPVVSSGSSEDEVVEVFIKNGGEALLAGSEHLVAPGTTLAEVPVAPVFAGRLIDAQVLTEHVAAADDVPRFNVGVHVAPALVPMAAGLPDTERSGRNIR